MNAVDDEVRRLLSQAAAPGLRLPKSYSEMQIALLDQRGRGLTGQERAWLQQASEFGVAVRIDIEDLILAGADTEEITSRLEDAAAEAIADLKGRYGHAGGEAGRVINETRRR
jgi:hypothetical protein